MKTNRSLMWFGLLGLLCACGKQQTSVNGRTVSTPSEAELSAVGEYQNSDTTVTGSQKLEWKEGPLAGVEVSFPKDCGGQPCQLTVESVKATGIDVGILGLVDGESLVSPFVIKLSQDLSGPVDIKIPIGNGGESLNYSRALLTSSDWLKVLSKINVTVHESSLVFRLPALNSGLSLTSGEMVFGIAAVGAVSSALFGPTEQNAACGLGLNAACVVGCPPIPNPDPTSSASIDPVTIVDDPLPSPSASAQAQPVAGNCPAMAVDLIGIGSANVNRAFSCYCDTGYPQMIITGGCSVVNADPNYMSTSSLCWAAKHAGVFDGVHRTLVTLMKKPGQGYYAPCTNSDPVTTQAWAEPSTVAGFTFTQAVPGSITVNACRIAIQGLIPINSKTICVASDVIPYSWIDESGETRWSANLQFVDNSCQPQFTNEVGNRASLMIESVFEPSCTPSP